MRAYSWVAGGWALIAGMFVGCGEGAAPEKAGQDRAVSEERALSSASSTGVTPLWVRTQGGSGLEDSNRVTHDAAGNAVVSFRYMGQADASGTPLAQSGDADDWHAAVVKYRPDGNVAWTQSFLAPVESSDNSDNVVRVNALTTNAAGDVFAGGDSYLGARVQGQVLQPGAFLARLEGSSGEVLWVRPVQPPPHTELYFEDFEATPEGDVVAIARMDAFTETGGYEGSWAKIMKLRGSDGELVWEHILYPWTWDDFVTAADLSVDEVGNIYFCGTFYGKMRSGGVVLSSPLSPSGSQVSAGFLVALHPTGLHRWTRLVSDQSETAAKSISAFRHRVILTATGNPAFQGQILPRGQYVLGYYSETAEDRWARQLTSVVSFGDRAFVRAHGEEAVVVVQNQASLLGVPRSRPVDPAYYLPGQTFFVARFWRTNGYFLGARNMEEVVPGLNGVLPSGVSISPVDEQVLVTGHFNGVMDFGTGTQVAPRGRADAFLLRLSR